MNKPQRKDIPGPEPETIKITQPGGGCWDSEDRYENPSAPDSKPAPEPEPEDNSQETNG